jgi:hypothetical protein
LKLCYDLRRHKESVLIHIASHVSVPLIETNRLMLFFFAEKIAVHCENHTEHTSTPNGQIAVFQYVGAGCTYSNAIYKQPKPWDITGFWSRVHDLGFQIISVF